ncbi:hypothetical protein CHUAL_008801 [Chamberlinius hualienensis]
MGLHKILAVFLFLTICVIFSSHLCAALKCWECRSDADNSCADPFDNSTYHFSDCERKTLPHIRGPGTMCRKIRQKVNGQWRYIRSCAWLSDRDKMNRVGDERYCLIRSGTWDIHIEYCECYSKDGCNSAKALGSSWKWTLAIILMVSVMKVIL